MSKRAGIAVAVVAALAVVGGFAVRRVAPRTGATKEAESDLARPSVVLAVFGEEPRILVAQRSTIGERAALELVRAADGSTIWKTALPNLAPDARAIAAADGAIVAVVSEQPGTTLVALDEVTGTVRWRVPFPGTAYRLWPHRDVLVVEGLSTSPTPLHGFDLATGKKLWESRAVSPEYAPALSGGDLLVPLRHAAFSALAIVDLHGGKTRETGAGFLWPGVARDQEYLCLQRAEPSPDVQLVALSPSTGEVRRVAAASGAERGGLFAVWKDRFVFQRDEETALVSRALAGDDERVLRAPDGYRFWSGGATSSKWLAPATWPYLAPTTRFVPAILNEQKTDAAKICLVDLDAHRFAWCAQKDLPGEGGPFGWLDETSRGDLHFFVVEKTLVVFDGNTGKLRGALSVRSTDGAIAGWPTGSMIDWARAGDVLAVRGEDHAWAVDLKTMSLAWSWGSRTLEVTDARGQAASVLGALPE